MTRWHDTMVDRPESDHEAGYAAGYHLRARHAGRNRHRLGVCDLTPQLALFEGPLQTGAFTAANIRDGAQAE